MNTLLYDSENYVSFAGLHLLGYIYVSITCGSLFTFYSDCGDPGGIPNATLKFGDNTLTGSVANYTCDVGYRPNPNSTGNKISCGPDGVWSTIRFSCEGIFFSFLINFCIFYFLPWVGKF